MKKSDIYEIALKILGVYLFIHIVALLRTIFSFLSYYDIARYSPAQVDKYSPMPELMASVIQLVIDVTLAYLLTFRTKRMTHLICSQQDYTETVQLITEPKYLYQIAMVLVGLSAIVRTFPDFLIKLQHHIHKVQLDDHSYLYDINYLLTEAIELLLGFLLIYYNRPISEILTKDKKKRVAE